MAGRGRYIYIHDEIDEKLQSVKNKSELVNRLLKEYFNKEHFLNLNTEQLKAELKINKMKKDMEKKIKELRSGK